MEKNKFRELPKYKDVKELIYDAARLYTNNIAFVTKVKEGKDVKYINHTYQNLLEDVNAFGTSLFNLGLKDKRVVVVGRNKYEWAVAHISNLMGGIISVPLDKELQCAELEDSIIRSKADAIVFDEKYIDNINQIKENGKTNLTQYICMNELDGFESVNNLIKSGREKIKQGNTEFLDYETDPNKMGILLFTSGTTSKSKAVMLSQGGITANIYDMTIVENLLPTDVNIAFLPYHHIFGSTAILVMLSRGVKTVFPDGLKYIKQNLIEYKVSVFVGVPLLVDKIYSNIEKEIEKQGKTNLIAVATKISNFLMKLHIDVRRKIFKQIIDQLGGAMRFIIAGGAPLDKKTAIKFNEMGIHLIQGYGLTETSPVIAAENDYFIKSGSVGIPMRNMQVDIVEKDEKGIGEIKVKGPNVMLGYYENEEATNAVLKDGWFYTGDLGYIDKEGFLFITGRKKDVIVLKNGKKVFPDELETLINRMEEVEDSFIYGMPDSEDINDIKVSVKIVYNETVIKEKYQDISEEELHKIIWEKVKGINKTLPPYKYIKNMILTKEPLIKTTTQKTKRAEELRRILNGNV